MNMCAIPKVILVFSGKRKSGKDYITEKLHERFGQEKSVILRLSGPLKKQYSIENSLDYEKLLDASDYKEKYRSDMIAWGEKKRNADPGYFCRLVTQEAASTDKSIWMISDSRRITDIDYFLTNYAEKTLLVRVTAEMKTRVGRGFQFTTAVDDAESECGLDDFEGWNKVIPNNGDDLEIHLQELTTMVESTMNKTDLT